MNNVSYFVHALLEILGIAFIFYIAVMLNNKTNEKNYKNFNDAKLEKELNKTLKLENYERAALIRDEINKRKKEGKWTLELSSNK